MLELKLLFDGLELFTVLLEGLLLLPLDVEGWEDGVVGLEDVDGLVEGVDGREELVDGLVEGVDGREELEEGLELLLLGRLLGPAALKS